MTDVAAAGGGMAPNSVANALLKASAVFWFLVALAGQWMFAYYVLAFYGGLAVQGDFAAWEKVLPHGIIAGDDIGNAAISGHLLLAFIITVCGPLQFIPFIRNRLPAFHRWNGRAYIVTAFAASSAGLYLVWTRGTVGGFVQHVAISLNAVLIMLFAVIAVRYAIARNIDTHRRWALRLFLAVSGVWFFRVGLMFWIFINQGPAGFDPKTFQGPFLTFWAFGQYLLPLAVLELYLRTQDSAEALGRFSMAAGLLVLTLCMGAGIVMATMGMWLPHL